MESFAVQRTIDTYCQSLGIDTILDQRDAQRQGAAVEMSVLIFNQQVLGGGRLYFYQ